jgi:hypothetical protein
MEDDAPSGLAAIRPLRTQNRLRHSHGINNPTRFVFNMWNCEEYLELYSSRCPDSVHISPNTDLENHSRCPRIQIFPCDPFYMSTKRREDQTTLSGRYGGVSATTMYTRMPFL